MSDDSFRTTRLFGVFALWIIAWIVIIVQSGTSARILKGHNDFLSIYTGARLCGTPDLYRADTVTRVQAASAGAISPSLRFTRAPFYAVVLSPLGRLPYRTAYSIWTLLNLAALVSFGLLWAKRSRADLFVCCCCSLPLLVSFINGQDIPLLLLLIAVSMRLVGSRNLIAAGLVLSLCAIKYHLFVLVPLVLVAQGLWRIVVGVSIGGMGLVGLSFLGGGSDWIAAYYKTLTDAVVHPKADVMPNLHGFTFNINHGTFVLCALTVTVTATCWLIGRRFEFGSAFAVALLGSLLVSYHSYAADTALLVPALLLLRDRGAISTPAALMMLSPVPWLMLLNGGMAANATRAALVLLFAALAWRAVRMPAPGVARVSTA